MNQTLKSILWWIVAFLFTVAFVIYQRTTGPTYKLSGNVKVNATEYNYNFPRSADNDQDALISITVPDTAISGRITYKRFKSHDTLTTVSMLREGNDLTFRVPKQPSAGKVEYSVDLIMGNEIIPVTDKPVVMRFKNPVPMFVLLPHIFVIFLAMLFSTRTGIEALRKGKNIYTFTWITFILFILGGCVLGPIMQKIAFGAYWTGWPFGHDLTDNKTLVALLAWLIALLKLRRNRQATTWVIIASIVMILVYLIPHSVLGSELDYTKQPQ